MTQQPDPADAPPALPALKVVEPVIVPDDPWCDDVLDRKQIADRLTGIIRGQQESFVISLDGRWGTGKTFLLKRWAHDLRNQDPQWQAIYYNAWEDDFAGDPLLAIVGRLSTHFEKGSFARTVCGFARLVPRLVDVAAPLTPFGHIWALLRGATGKLRSKPSPPESVRRYNERRATADGFKLGLTNLGAEVREKTDQPLVFIIDELDRCRPTFAIELLERVKHIFDVPNIVFVFGINHSELTKSLRSVYGEIDAGEYLRRFFDMEFVLPDGDPTRFCAHLLEQFQLLEFLRGLTTSTGRQHATEAVEIGAYLPVLLGNMGLSLRDMDYCVRLLSLAAMGLAGRYPLHPELFPLLVAVKVKDPTLYRRFVERGARGAEVINYLDGCTPAGIGGAACKMNHATP